MPTINCSHAYHDQLKASPELFAQSTTPAYWQPDTESGVEMEFRHCRWCGSTLNIGVTRPLRTEHVLEGAA